MSNALRLGYFVLLAIGLLLMEGYLSPLRAGEHGTPADPIAYARVTGVALVVLIAARELLGVIGVVLRRRRNRPIRTGDVAKVQVRRKPTGASV